MSKEMKEYMQLLSNELIPAFGCTEPIALAFAAAKAVEVLGCFPDRINVQCSGNIIKNVKSVIIPNSGGKKGIEYAAILGALVAKPDKGLELLKGVSDADRIRAEELYEAGLCTVELLPEVENLHICAEASSKGINVAVTVEKDHTHVSRIERNGEIIYLAPCSENSFETLNNEVKLNFEDIYEFAAQSDLSEIEDILALQAEYNLSIAEEGLRKAYGANIGKLFREESGGFAGVEQKAKAYASAASDARMSGCAKPVVINAGSGNQGITVSLPVLVYAEHYGKNREELYRALLFSNLTGIYIKQGIGRLSAYCGVVSAAAAGMAGVAFLLNEPKKVVAETLVNALATLSGTICDGAKPSCALKIATSVDAAIMAYKQAKSNNSFHSGDGIVKGSVDATIEAVCTIGRKGMKETDTVILKTMLAK